MQLLTKDQALRLFDSWNVDPALPSGTDGKLIAFPRTADYPLAIVTRVGRKNMWALTFHRDYATCHNKHMAQRQQSSV